MIVSQEKTTESDKSIPESIIPIKLPIIQDGEDSNPDIRAKRDVIRNVILPLCCRHIPIFSTNQHFHFYR